MAKISKKDLVLNRFYGSLVGLWVGDGMGMPVETMTPQQIEQEVGRITGFIAPVQKYIKGTVSLPPGHWTDDWQLARAILRSLVQCNGYNINDIIGQHIIALEESTMGWGRATKNELAAIKKFFATGGVEGRNPATPPTLIAGQGTGNGVAMKIAPLALYQAINQGSFQRLPLVTQVKEIGFLTHADPRATVAAFAVAAIIGRVLYSPFVKKTWNVFAEREFLRWLMEIVRWSEEEIGQHPEPFSGALAKLLDPKVRNHVELLQTQVGTSCFALESVVFSIGVFLRHPTDFRAGILEAVNAGGDTDTNAAMVGAMIGANVSLWGIPQEWRYFLMEHHNDGYRELLSLGGELFLKNIENIKE